MIYLYFTLYVNRRTWLELAKLATFPRLGFRQRVELKVWWKLRIWELVRITKDFTNMHLTFPTSTFKIFQWLSTCKFFEFKDKMPKLCTTYFLKFIPDLWIMFICTCSSNYTFWFLGVTTNVTLFSTLGIFMHQLAKNPMSSNL